MSTRPTTWDFRKFHQLLRKNGYQVCRKNGDHHIYKNAAGRTMPVNIHLNKVVALRLIKEYGLIVA